MAPLLYTLLYVAWWERVSPLVLAAFGDYGKCR
jgi:hypothetical protein